MLDITKSQSKLITIPIHTCMYHNYSSLEWSHKWFRIFLHIVSKSTPFAGKASGNELMNIIIPDVQDDRAGGDLSETMVSRQEIKDSVVFFFHSLLWSHFLSAGRQNNYALLIWFM